MKRIVVTGAAGFIGSHLVRELARRGHEVVGIDREHDLCSADLDAVLGRGYDEAYHLAAIVGVQKVCAAPAETLRNNALSTLRFLDWARGAVRGRLLFGSTSETYAAFYGTGLLPLPTPEDVPVGVRDLHHPRWSYAVSKIFGEAAFVHSGRPFSVVRYHNVYGPGMRSTHVVPELFSRIWQGESPLKVASAAHTRSFCYVSDAVAATIAVMEAAEAEGEVVNVASDDAEIAMGELARRMVRISGRRIEVVDAPAVDASVERRRAGIARLRAILGPRAFVPLEDGLRACWDWQQRTGWIARAA